MKASIQFSSKILLLTLSILLAFHLNSYAQHTVEGTVTEASTGDPLPGVNVLVQGTDIGTATNMDGRYSLEAPSGQETLTFSFVGFQTREIPINGRSTINVNLTPQAVSGEELVVVGYGTQQRDDVTGSISSVSSDDWESSSISTPDQALQGRVSGVQVSRMSHAPGGGIDINIRGTASLNASGAPLYVIDGMPISVDEGGNTFGTGTVGTDPNPLNSIDPSSIQSIEVLKDASATAIYGSRGANGVVIITTKEGATGSQQINFSTSVGVQNIQNKLDFMSARQWAKQANEAAEFNGQPPAFTDQQLSSLGEGTNWQDVIYGTALQQQHNLSFSGGSEDLRYYIGGSHKNNEGIVRGTSFKRYGLTARINAQPSDKWSINGSLRFTTDENNQVPTDTKGYGGFAGIVDVIIEAPPHIPARDTAGNPVNMGNHTLGAGLTNPLTLTDEYEQTGTTNRFLSSFDVSYDITDNLVLQTSLGIDFRDNRFREYYAIGTERGGSGGTAAQDDDRIVNFLTETTISYNNNFGDLHNIDAVAGFTYQQEKFEGVSGEARGFPSDFFRYNNLSLATSPSSPGTFASKWQLVSYLGRVNYSFQDTYQLTVTGRVDGSSKFGVNNLWGFFPSVAVGWQLGNEPFIQDLDLFSQLKLRASYGQTGNESIGTYNSLSTISTGLGRRGAVYWNGQQNPTASPSGVPNPDLSWEKTAEWNAGLDIGLFEQRLQLSANYFIKETTDLIFEVPIPNQTGFGSVLQNTGSMENRGFEFEAFSNNIVGEFNWNTNFNISFTENEVTDLAGADQLWAGWVGGGNVTTHSKFTVRVVEGGPVGRWYGSVYMGPWESQEQIDQVGTMPGARPGEPRFKDTNGDGTYNAVDDDVFIGDANPDFSFGLRNNFNYKQWGLEVFAYGQVGQDVLNLTKQFHLENGMGVNARRLDRWTPNNRDSNIPAAWSPPSLRTNSFWVEDGSFLRIQNVTLSYNLPVQNWNTALREAQIGVAVDNLAVITNYSGYDPEVNALGGNNTVQFMDRFSYPSSRTFRVNVSFGF